MLFSGPQRWYKGWGLGYSTLPFTYSSLRIDQLIAIGLTMTPITNSQVTKRSVLLFICFGKLFRRARYSTITGEIRCIFGKWQTLYTPGDPWQAVLPTLSVLTTKLIISSYSPNCLAAVCNVWLLPYCLVTAHNVWLLPILPCYCLWCSATSHTTHTVQLLTVTSFYHLHCLAIACNVPMLTVLQLQVLTCCYP